MPWLSQFKQRVRELKSETFALYLAARHPATPWYAKLLVAGIVAYAFSPIDFIPDFVPILGYVDELILIPLGVGSQIDSAARYGRVSVARARSCGEWKTRQPCCGFRNCDDLVGDRSTLCPVGIRGILKRRVSVNVRTLVTVCIGSRLCRNSNSA